METLIRIAGIVQLSILSASMLVPAVMDYNTAMATLKPMVRKLICVYSFYVAGTILFLGLLSVLYPGQILNDGAMKLILIFYAIFWGARLILQLFVYEMKEFLKEWWMKLGYNMLTIAFAYLTGVYSWAIFV